MVWSSVRRVMAACASAVRSVRSVSAAWPAVAAAQRAEVSTVQRPSPNASGSAMIASPATGHPRRCCAD